MKAIGIGIGDDAFSLSYGFIIIRFVRKVFAIMIKINRSIPDFLPNLSAIRVQDVDAVKSVDFVFYFFDCLQD